ncbi:MAG: hypothetical protein L7S52_05990 [Flavobacteriaceae bacterium]|jgi:hypothetical protein|nr:hypothetical protein [Flavobacteriaceae bacterium]
MFKKYLLNAFVLLCSFLLPISCSKDNDTPEHIHEEELITRVTLKIKKQGSADAAVTYTWNDDHEEEGHSEEEEGHDEDGVHVELEANSTYEVEVGFFNASDPADIEDITEEVKAEADEHQVFLELIEIQGLSIVAAANDSTDSNGNPLFLKSVWTTTAVSAGEVRVYLIHEPTAKSGSTRNDFGGEIDVKVDFHVDVE